MKKPILTIDQFYSFGFKYQGKEYLENGDFYRWWKLEKNESELHITYEFDAKFNFTTGYVDFNCEKLSGRELTKEDIQMLIEIM
jgi:hypothetical protein